jgi:hypothetical protein
MAYLPIPLIFDRQFTNKNGPTPNFFGAVLPAKKYSPLPTRFSYEANIKIDCSSLLLGQTGYALRFFKIPKTQSI